MHKKLYSLVISGIIVVNTACSTGHVYANIIDTEKDIKLEKISSEGEDDDVVVPEASKWATFTTVGDLKGKWEYDETDQKITLKKYLDGTAHPIVEIPRVIDNKPVELEGLNGGVFKNVTHLRVSKGNEDKVKLLAKEYQFGENHSILINLLLIA